MGCNQSVNQYDRELQEAKKADSRKHKLLLLGTGNSGKSTFLRQLLKLHGQGFFQSGDRLVAIRFVHESVMNQMRNIIDTCCEVNQYELSPQGEKAATFIKDHARDTNITQEVADAIKIIWNEENIKKTFENRSQLGIVDSCPHYFNNIDNIADPNYTPTDDDILLARVATTGIQEANFDLQNNHFSIFDVGGQRNERSKWIHCFDHVSAILFVAALSCYDQMLYEDTNVNAMNETLNLFDEISNSRYFRQASIILFLNKSDLFREKILKKSLNVCFNDYNGPNYNDYAYEEGIIFIKNKFKSLAISRINNNNNNNNNEEEKKKDRDINFHENNLNNHQKNHSQGSNISRSSQGSIAINDDQAIYTHVTCATDRNNVNKVFEDVQHHIVMKALRNHGLL